MSQTLACLSRKSHLIEKIYPVSLPLGVILLEVPWGFPVLILDGVGQTNPDGPTVNHVNRLVRKLIRKLTEDKYFFKPETKSSLPPRYPPSSQSQTLKKIIVSIQVNRRSSIFLPFVCPVSLLLITWTKSTFPKEEKYCSRSFSVVLAVRAPT